MSLENIKDLYSKFWDILESIRDKIYEFSNEESEHMYEIVSEHIKKLSYIAEVPSNQNADQNNVSITKIQLPVQHLLTALVHVYIKLSIFQNNKNDQISLFYKSIAHECRLILEYEIKKTKDILKSEDEKIVHIYKMSFDKVLKDDDLELRRKCACIVARCDIFLNEILSDKSNEKLDYIINDENTTIWNTNSALKLIISKKMKIEEILNSPNFLKCIHLPAYTNKDDELYILSILLQKYNVEKNREDCLQKFHDNPEALSEKLNEFRIIKNKLDLELAKHDTSKNIANKMKHDVDNQEQKKVHYYPYSEFVLNNTK
jgi:hypothetical protein